VQVCSRDGLKAYVT